MSAPFAPGTRRTTGAAAHAAPWPYAIVRCKAFKFGWFPAVSRGVSEQTYPYHFNSFSQEESREPAKPDRQKMCQYHCQPARFLQRANEVIVQGDAVQAAAIRYRQPVVAHLLKGNREFLPFLPSLWTRERADVDPRSEAMRQRARVESLRCHASADRFHPSGYGVCKCQRTTFRA